MDDILNAILLLQKRLNQWLVERKVRGLKVEQAFLVIGPDGDNVDIELFFKEVKVPKSLTKEEQFIQKIMHHRDKASLHVSTTAKELVAVLAGESPGNWLFGDEANAK